MPIFFLTLWKAQNSEMDMVDATTGRSEDLVTNYDSTGGFWTKSYYDLKALLCGLPNLSNLVVFASLTNEVTYRRSSLPVS